jgi:hypothetical protein
MTRFTHDEEDMVLAGTADGHGGAVAQRQLIFHISNDALALADNDTSLSGRWSDCVQCAAAGNGCQGLWGGFIHLPNPDVPSVGW